ncbi:unnamed protein product, partial [marine sediment metagenome]
PEGMYTHSKSDKTIRIHGGGQIQYFGIDDSQKIGSYGFTGCAIDEAVELDENDWRWISGRCRIIVPDIKHQIYAACNPGSPSHFLARRFGLAPDQPIEPNCEVIQTKSMDNI